MDSGRIHDLASRISLGLIDTSLQVVMACPGPTERPHAGGDAELSRILGRDIRGSSANGSC